MRRLIAVLGFAVLAASPALAKEPKCPLDAATCLDQFGKMRDNPWFGVMLEDEKNGTRTIQDVIEGGPAQKSGVMPGDELEKIDGLDEAKRTASRAGWRTLPGTEFHVRRAGKEIAIRVTPQRIPEPILAKLIGKHMIEAHLAYEHQESESQQR